MSDKACNSYLPIVHHLAVIDLKFKLARKETLKKATLLIVDFYIYLEYQSNLIMDQTLCTHTCSWYPRKAKRLHFGQNELFSRLNY